MTNKLEEYIKDNCRVINGNLTIKFKYRESHLEILSNFIKVTGAGSFELIPSKMNVGAIKGLFPLMLDSPVGNDLELGKDYTIHFMIDSIQFANTKYNEDNYFKHVNIRRKAFASTVEYINKDDVPLYTKESSAVRTLEGLRYTYRGGEQWRPPMLCTPTPLDRIDIVVLLDLNDKAIVRVLNEGLDGEYVVNTKLLKLPSRAFHILDCVALIPHETKKPDIKELILVGGEYVND